jgi:uncharacterized membrane protein
MMSRRLLLGLMTLLLLISAYAVRSLPRLPAYLSDITGGLRGQILVLVLVSLTHAFFVLGWRHTLVFFGLSTVLSWCFEQAGVATGMIYGPYHYTDVLGMRLGHVPVLIPLAWFMLIYLSYVTANLLVGDPPVGSAGVLHRRGLGQVLRASFLGAMVMTAGDLVLDPMLSGPDLNAWTWEQGGPYFGIPMQNYAGWMLTALSIHLAYRLVECRMYLRRIGPAAALIATLPLAAYGCIVIWNSLAAGLPAWRAIGSHIVGLPLFAAAAYVWQRERRWIRGQG